MIKVHVWYPVNSVLDSPATALFDDFPLDLIPEGSLQRFGHGAIEFIGIPSESDELVNEYRAFWPAASANWTEPSPGRVLTSFASDVEDEGSEPTRTITLREGLNEALVLRYWYSLARQPLDYSFDGFNCCTAVATSIGDGFPQHPPTTPPMWSPMTWAGGYVPWAHSNPYYLEEWVNEINSWLTTF